MIMDSPPRSVSDWLNMSRRVRDWAVRVDVEGEENRPSQVGEDDDRMESRSEDNQKRNRSHYQTHHSLTHHLMMTMKKKMTMMIVLLLGVLDRYDSCVCLRVVSVDSLPSL